MLNVIPKFCYKGTKPPIQLWLKKFNDYMIVEMWSLIVGEEHVASMTLYSLRNDSWTIVNDRKKVLLLATPVCINISFHWPSNSLFSRCIRSPDLSQDMVSEMFFILLVKSIVKFPCVYKSWCALIFSREFIKCHI